VKYTYDEAALARGANDAYRLYRRRFDIKYSLVPLLRNCRNALISGLRKLRGVRADPNPRIEIDKIHFLGVWDTVDAYGGPIEEITRAIDYWIWPLSMPDRFMSTKINRACHGLALEDERDAFRPVLWDERYVRDKQEKLHPMQPVGWTPGIDTTKYSAAIDQMRLSQVWFVGVHSDIGGGYPQDGLSYVTLDWMIDRALPYGLLLLQPAHDQLKLSVNEYDRLNDSRHGLAGYYRYKPRNLREIYHAPSNKPSMARDIRYLADMFTGQNEHQKDVNRQLVNEADATDVPDPMIHQAVFNRVWAGTDGYAPVMLPPSYRLTDKQGRIHALVNDNGETIARNPQSGELARLDASGQLKPLEPAAAIAADPALLQGFRKIDEGQSPFNRQQHAWNWVWWRRVVYFLTVFASLFLAALPLIAKWKPGLGSASPFEFIRPIFSLIALFVPSFVSVWLDAFKNSPGRFLLGATLVAILLFVGGSAQGKIRDIMRAIWQRPDAAAAQPTDNIYRLRSSAGYRAFFYILKHWVFPFVFAVLLWLCILVALYFAVALISRATFGAANTLGFVCVPKGGEDVTAAESKPSPFLTRDVCTSTGLAVKKRATYRVVINVTSPWIDGYYPGKSAGIPTDPRGFGWNKTTPLHYLGLPYRRLMWSNWFAPVLRIGSKGIQEHRLDTSRRLRRTVA
jgi:hypothetical protein